MIESEEILGVKTDTFHLGCIYRFGGIPAGNDRKSLHIFLIAGNPGTLHFYICFLQKLLVTVQNSAYFAKYDRISCHGVGHANHHLQCSLTSKDIHGISDETASYGLEFQIRHKAAFITSVLECPRHNLEIGNSKDDTDVMMVGHSIGAYMVIDVLTRSEELMHQTKHILLLMPFISWTHLPLLHRTKLSSFLALHPLSQRLLTSLASPLLRMEPSMRRSVLRRLTGLKGDILDKVSDGLINKRLLDNFLAMGVDEIRDVRINQRRMISLLEELDRGSSCKKKDIFVLYTDNDEWAPLKDSEILRDRLKINTTIIIENGLTHAFSLTDERVERSCSIISNYFETLNFSRIQKEHRDKNGLLKGNNAMKSFTYSKL